MTLRMMSAPLSYFATMKPFPVLRANKDDPKRESKFAKRTISKALTPFSLQAILVRQMNANCAIEYKFVAMTALRRFVFIAVGKADASVSTVVVTTSLLPSTTF